MTSEFTAKRRPVLRPGSVRTQLIAWNVFALALLLAALGLTVRYSVKRLMMQSIDQELIKRSHQPRRPADAPPGGAAATSPTNRYALYFPDDDAARLIPAQDRQPGDQPGPPGDFGPNSPEGGPGPGGGLNDGNGPARRPGPPPQDDGPYRPAIFDMQGRSLDQRSRKTPWDSEAFNDMQSKSASVSLSGAGMYALATVTIDGLPFRLITVARQDPNFHRVIVQIPYPLTDVYRALQELDQALLTMIPIALICAGAGGWYLTGRVLSRVSRMTTAASNIGAKDLSQRLPVTGDDEFSELAATFNGMLGRLETVFARQEQILHQQRRFTADASHELKTPLTIIKGNTSLAMSVPLTEEDYKQSIVEIDTAANTMSKLVQDLLLLARSDSGLAAAERADIPVVELLHQAIKVVKPLRKILIDFMPPDADIMVNGNQEELIRLFKNLLDNAIRYSPEDGCVHVSAVIDGDHVRVDIADSGEGIAPEHLPHLGERFYRIDSSRTRPTGGTGLGLSICKGIAEAHGGKMVFQSVVGTGTTVQVFLPLKQQA